MNCPVCDGTRMREVEKNGILIDVCPTCKGVWLDRGELDKLMQDVKTERQDYNEWYYGDSEKPVQGQQAPYREQQSSSHKHSQYPPYKKKKKNVLDVIGDLFD